MRKQLLPRFCNPGTNHSFSEPLALSENQGKLVKLATLPSLITKTKPTTPKRPATWNPEAESQFIWDKVLNPCLKLLSIVFRLMHPSIFILFEPICKNICLWICDRTYKCKESESNNKNFKSCNRTSSLKSQRRKKTQNYINTKKNKTKNKTQIGDVIERVVEYLVHRFSCKTFEDFSVQANTVSVSVSLRADWSRAFHVHSIARMKW